jgi:hypothetical protein
VGARLFGVRRTSALMPISVVACAFFFCSQAPLIKTDIMNTVNNTYPALKFPASELSAFGFISNFFSISLRNGNIIHFMPDDVESFYNWLLEHGVRDIRNDLLVEETTPVVVGSPKGWRRLFRRIKKIK